MARRAYPFVPPIAWRLLRTRHDSEAKMVRVGVPLLILQGDGDGEAPVRGRPGAKWFRVTAGAGHNDTHIVGGEPYFDTLRGFLKGLDSRGSVERP
jgi:hypothetical protein